MRSGRSAIILGGLIGLLVGLGLYTFVYARGYSYLTNKPEACANCHVMQDYYSGWINSSHRSVAMCNDCHTPHNFVGKYAIKATNGFFHSLAFTTGKFPDNIQIKGYNHRVTESTCKTCHAELTYSILGVHSGKDISCIKCHSNVGHSAASFSLSSDSLVSGPSGPGAPASSPTDNPPANNEGSQNGNHEQH